MRHDIERSLGEILKRGEALSKKRHKRAACILGTLSGLAVCLLVFVFYSVADLSGTEMINSPYGAFLLSREAGGYVLLGVVCFVLGAGISMGAMRFSKGYCTNCFIEREAERYDKT